MSSAVATVASAAKQGLKVEPLGLQLSGELVERELHGQALASPQDRLSDWRGCREWRARVASILSTVMPRPFQSAIFSATLTVECLAPGR